MLRTEQIGDSYVLSYRYDTDGKLVAVSSYNISTEAVNILYAQTNTRGDVVALYDGNGETRVIYTYDSWGKLVSVTDGEGNALGANKLGNLNSIRYRGYVYDSETGLYYLQSRYYDPEVGRFLNADSVDYIGYSSEQLSYNAFAYCENDAVNGIDSVGLWAYDVHAGYYNGNQYKKITYGVPSDFNYGYKIPYYKVGKEYRYYGTYYWALISGFQYNKTSREYAIIIAKACNDVDTIFTPFSTSVSNQSWHFNTNGKKQEDSRIEKANDYISEAMIYFDKAMKAYENEKSYKNNVKQGCIYFGYALHALQDYYAHSPDRCFYVMVPSSFSQTGLNNGKYTGFWMHSLFNNTDTAKKRTGALKNTEDLTVLLLITLFLGYRKILIRKGK